ncbi:MAG TPA: PaaI family thioesterase [Actinomycetota bacterium]
MSEVTPIPDEFAPPFHRALKIRMGLGAAGEGVAWVDVDPEVHYGNRWVHGGLAGALADIASGVAIARAIGNPESAIDGTIDLKINFLRKVVEGDLTATATILHLGRRVAVTEVAMTSGGTLVAKAVATFMLRRPEPGDAAAEALRSSEDA